MENIYIDNVDLNNYLKNFSKIFNNITIRATI